MNTRVVSAAVWQIWLFLLNGLVFFLLGMQLPTVVRRVESSNGGDVVIATVAIVLTVVIARIVWVFPGAYAPVISAGSVGWEDQWLDHPGDQDSHTAPANSFRYRMWWLQNVLGDGAGTTGDLEPPLNANSGQVVDPTLAEDVFVSDFSSRSLNADQDLDVLAPGDWVRGPFGGDPGYNHLPGWSRGLAALVSNNSRNI